MIRPLIILVLLSTSFATGAQPLYKWVEKDGAITFSVQPPPAGVSFETINPDQSSQDKSSADTSSGISSSDPAAPNLSTQKTTPSVQSAVQQSAATTQRPSTIAPMQALQASPRANSADSSLVRGNNTQLPESTNGRSSRVTPLDQSTRAAMNARNRKQQQCEDLKKRVVSLERRLQTRLTPDDMDNTVVHMARYQRSFDQHCVQ